MNRIKTTLQFAIGFCGITVGLVVAAQLCGVIPSGLEMQRLRRQSICESLAVHCSLAARNNDEASLREIVKIVTNRRPDIAYVGITTTGERKLLEHGDAKLSHDLPVGMVAADVPVLSGNRPWGNVRVVFRGTGDGWATWLEDPAIRLVVFIAVTGLITFSIYSWILTRMFVQPGGPLPGRVRETLDSFSEGILVLDDEHRIAFANLAFQNIAGQSADTLTGSQAQELDWGSSEPLPWESGESNRATLDLTDASSQTRRVSTRTIPLLADDGDFYGTLATFDDLTSVEHMNHRLRKLLNLLKKSRGQVREKNRELKRLATEDPLTHCLNRRAFFEHPAVSGDAPRCCMMLDVDHFKSVNDNHGHAAGDEVLKGVARTLRETCHEAGVVCRYGGEEFCILLPDADLASSVAIADLLRRKIEELRFGDLKVTASFGVAQGAGESIEDLLNNADKALYEAKETGRNRVVTFQPPREQCQTISFDAG